ncbi:hypothetical protein N7462_008062 [Penicillium macrosclerotiorum]|uniref:uncharacterized protein n=1 Tax=Penicillium macrosclerotiorum TaxID=303699 RepID=UPI0025466E48|nr:uncharacterized protein N7462_008062 [Penicillium macrosclerotiorum]KAJ5679818.1 hypothetical protein N7462_008062 [Penicillium macrosclerotiorum]
MLQEISALTNAKSVLTAAISTLIIYIVTTVIYNVYFHPLSRFPGPISHAISRIPYFCRAIRGTLPFDMLELHESYGDIVRIAPNELAFSHPDAWKDLFGHKNGEAEMTKANWFYRPLDEPLHIVNENTDEHRLLRRQMAHGFSEKSMRAQEPMIRKYVDLLLQKLHENCKSGSLVIFDWYNFTTFDIIGDLAFGEPFGCLEGCNYDHWIKGIFEGAYVGTLLQALSFVPSLKYLLLSLVPKSMKEAHQKHKDLTKAKMLRRVAISEERPDLIEGLLKKKDELKLGIEKLISNAEILIIGGSETTASALSRVTYLLLQNPSAYEKLKDEVRSSFDNQEEITLISVNRLSYMLACLDEALRMYPPIANGLPRVCPKGGARVLGEYIPENTNISIHQWALYRRQKYFKDPNSYHPERFLSDPKFVDDCRDAFQPFHTGPRNCLGRNLAYSEMRLILALIMFNFDMKIADESKDWMKQRNFLMWEKGPLKVHLTPRTLTE